MKLRFVLDENVDVRVRKAICQLGHDCWSVRDAGLGGLADDQLTVYAQEHDAVLVTHDAAFSDRRRKNVIGRHIFLDCSSWDASSLLLAHLPQVEAMLVRSDLWVGLSVTGCEFSWAWK